MKILIICADCTRTGQEVQGPWYREVFFFFSTAVQHYLETHHEMDIVVEDV